MKLSDDAKGWLFVFWIVVIGLIFWLLFIAGWIVR